MLRISEALNLTNQDIAGRPEILRIVGKGNKERLIPVLPVIWQAVDKYIALRPFGNQPDDNLFRSVRGLPMSPRMAEKVIENLRNYLQLPDYVTPHALRHTFATKCVRAGFDIKTLSEILGHASVSFTLNRYVHSDLDSKRKQMDILNDSWKQMDINIS